MFAKWAGINIDDARVTWNRFAGHVAAVDVNGQERVLLAEDVDAARSRSAERPVGVRLLPPNDALFAVDREIVEPEPARRASAFPAYAQPGVVLVDGRLEGT